MALPSSRFMYPSHIVPSGASEDNLSQNSDVREMGYRQEENEWPPPPPYPGKIILIAPRHTHAVDSAVGVHSVNENSRNQESETAGLNFSRSSNRESLEARD